MSFKNLRNSALLVALLSIGAIAAVKGDSPASKNGRVLVQAYDGGAAGRSNIPLMIGQNAVALQNLGIVDGGTSQVVYCGWNGSPAVVENLPQTGFQIPIGGVLSIDIVGNNVLQTDGGALAGTGNLLYCAAAPGALSEMDVRYMMVK
jgi:hypothetical protein